MDLNNNIREERGPLGRKARLKAPYRPEVMFALKSESKILWSGGTVGSVLKERPKKCCGIMAGPQPAGR